MAVIQRLMLFSVAVVVMLWMPLPSAAQQPSDTAEWDTTDLIEDVEALTADELPRLQARAESGDARSQVLLGLAHEFGSAGLSKQPDAGLPWFLRAAAQGVSWAESWAADFYLAGSAGVERDLAKARDLYTSAATRGDARAAFMVGQLYFFGEGVDSDMRAAATWFRRAAVSEPALATPMAEIAEVTCDARLCDTLRQVMGAMVSGGTGRLIAGWNAASHEWDAALPLPGNERCGVTSSDRTEGGDPLNFFCDSAPITDDARGAAVARELASQVQRALPAGYMRTDRTDGRPGPSTFFTREGFPRLRVTHNLTPGSAQHRVTLLVGP